MIYDASFECPFCGFAFCEHIDGAACFEPPELGDSVFCECPECKKVGGFEILGLVTEPEF